MVWCNLLLYILVRAFVAVMASGCILLHDQVNNNNNNSLMEAVALSMLYSCKAPSIDDMQMIRDILMDIF